MPRSKRQTTALLIALTCLSGCGTAAVYSCPPLKTYPPAFSKALAGELGSMQLYFEATGRIGSMAAGHQGTAPVVIQFIGITGRQATPAKWAGGYLPDSEV